MTRRKSPHDLDTFHAHLDALKLFFIREHYCCRSHYFVGDFSVYS